MEGLDQFGLRIQVRRTRHLHCLHSLVPAHDPSSLPHSSCGPYTPFLVRVVIGVQYVYDVDDGHSLNCPLMANATRFTEPLWSRSIT